MSTPSTESKSARKYPFIDFIRFVSIAGIVWAHTEAFPEGTNAFAFLQHNGNAVSYIFFKQIFKFSVFCFFMISGFLVGGKIREVSAWTYFRRRMDSILKPYCIALILFLLIYFGRNLLVGHETLSVRAMARSTFYLILNTPFWFIPAYFFSLAILLVFVRYIDSLVFGGILLLITLAFTFANEYSAAFVRNPNTAFLAYVFYLWLGVFIRKKNLVDTIMRGSAWLPGGLALLLYVLSSLESLQLFYAGQQYFFSILRVSNQLYALAVFAFLVRICDQLPSFRFIDPRKETYGIYLYHFFFVALLFPPVYLWIARSGTLDMQDTGNVILLSVAHFVLCFGLTLLFVKMLNRYRVPIL